MKFDDATRFPHDAQNFRFINDELWEWWVMDGRLYCRFFPEARWRYPGMETDSAFGIFYGLLLENPRQPALADWVELGVESWDNLRDPDGLNAFDELVMTDPANWLTEDFFAIYLEQYENNNFRDFMP